MSEADEPYCTIDRGGIRVHIPRKDGSEISFTLSAENAQALVVSVAKRYAELGTSEGKLAAASDLFAWLLK
jgi:hypothetical protein